jgi:hypothetical protein
MDAQGTNTEQNGGPVSGRRGDWYNAPQMTIVDLVAKLREAQHRADAIARIIGYTVMIQRLGWDNLPVNRITRYNLEKMFRLLEIDPHSVEI